MTATVKNVNEIVEAVKKVNQDIKDYFWMANQLEQKEVASYLNITSYGEEAGMPRSTGSKSDPTYRIAQYNIRFEERKHRILEKVTRLEYGIEQLQDERERMVIEACMDRVTLREVGAILGISKQAVYDIKESAIRKLAVTMYLQQT